MTATNTMYPKALDHGIDYVNDTMKIALLTGYTFDATHEFFSDVSGDEITGTGYSAGGETLTTVTATYDSGTKTWKFTCDDPTWTTATFDCDQAVIYKSTGTGSTSPLVSCTDFGGTQSPVARDFVLTVPTTGFATRAVA